MLKPQFLTRFLTIGMLLSLALLNLQPVHADDGSWYKCDNKSGQYYRPVFPAFRKHSIQILHEANEKLEQTLETNVDDVTFLNRSPNCQYLAAEIYQNKDNPTVVWDLVTGKRVGEFNRRAQITQFYMTWDDSSRFLAVPTRIGTFLWDVATNVQLQVNDIRCGFIQFAVDVSRQQLLAVSWYEDCLYYYGDQGVSVYDLRTAQKIGYFGNPGRGYAAHFTISPDGKQIRVSASDGTPFGSTTWDRDTHTIISADGVLAPGDIQISPDKRYLAIHDYDMYVFDLEQPRFSYDSPYAAS